MEKKSRIPGPVKASSGIPDFFCAEGQDVKKNSALQVFMPTRLAQQDDEID
jgi:hypothetical protein